MFKWFRVTSLCLHTGHGNGISAVGIVVGDVVDGAAAPLALDACLSCAVIASEAVPAFSSSFSSSCSMVLMTVLPALPSIVRALLVVLDMVLVRPPSSSSPLLLFLVF